MLTYKNAVLQLYYSLYGSNASNFHALLYRLINKADPTNKALLRLGFPVEVLVFDDWQQSTDERDFFKEHMDQV